MSNPAVRSAQAILEARARALAKPVATNESADVANSMEALVCFIGTERYAVALHSITAIARITSITPLPQTVPPVFGVTAWRGRPITLLSLEANVPALDDSSRILVLGAGRRAAFALLVTAVDETAVIDRAALVPVSSARAALSAGVTADGILLLDAEALINSARAES